MKGNTLMKWRMRSNPAARYGSGIFFFFVHQIFLSKCLNYFLNPGPVSTVNVQSSC